MNKEELHDKLRSCQTSVTISSQEITDIYGNDTSRKMRGVDTSRTDVLARTYNLSVTKNGNDYLFVKEEI